MNVTIKQTRIKLSEYEREMIKEKLSSLDKFFPKIQDIRIEIEQDVHHRKGNVIRCEANVKIPRKLIRVDKVTNTVEKSVNKVRDHLKVMLSREKTKMTDYRQKSNKDL